MTWPELLDAVARFESRGANAPASPGDSPHSADAPPIPISLVTDDSRKVQPAAVFVAIKGANHDGHDFIPQASAAGAAVIVAERPVDVPPGVLLHVTRNASAWLARAAAVRHGLDRLQQRGELPVVGVTGTNGKTTTTYLVQSMLADAERPCAVIGTVSYDLVGRRLAAPLTTPPAADLAAMLVEAHGHGARAAAMEVSSHSLEQHRVEGIRFGVGVFTNLTGDHLDYHGTMEAYAAAKKRLFDRLPADGAAVINAEDPRAEYMVSECAARIIRFALSGEADLTADILSMSTDGTRVVFRWNGRTVEARTALFGRHNVMNLLAAVGAGLALGLDLETAAGGAARLSRVRGRLERVDSVETGFAVLVDYAHTDDALRHALQTLRPLTTGRLWCVFGCGGDRDRTKRPRMAQVAAEIADRIVITSDNPRTEDPLAIIADIRAGVPADAADRCVVEPDRAAAIQRAIRDAAGGDTVLIAGKGHEDYQIIGTRKIHFDDVEVAAAELPRRRSA